MAKIYGQLERAQAENIDTGSEPSAGVVGRFWFNTTTGQMRVDNGSTISDVGAGLTVPTGTVLDFAGPEGSAPTGFLICDGASYATATYPSLFALIGYTYGGGGANFNVPDCRGRVLAGKDDMGGAAANRVTNAESGITGTTLGDSGGAESHALTTAELAAHNHTASSTSIVTDPGHTHTIPSSFASNVVGGANTILDDIGAGNSTASATTGITVATTTTVNNNGSGDTHQNTQPTMIMNKIIKT